MDNGHGPREGQDMKTWELTTEEREYMDAMLAGEPCGECGKDVVGPEDSPFTCTCEDTE